MTDKHTQGRLTLELVESDSGIIKHLCPVDAEDMSILTVVEHEGVKFAAVYHSEDARRLVACWNACEGLPTAWIEGGAADILEHAKSLKSQRDELLGALTVLKAQCELMAASDWRKWEELASPEEFERWVKSRAAHMAVQATAAIAKATGENQ